MSVTAVTAGEQNVLGERNMKPPDKAVILSEALRRSIASRGLYSAESKDPGDACWQLLLGAFRPQTPTVAKRSDLLFFPPTPILSSVTFSLRHATSCYSGVGATKGKPWKIED
jgi:hypothetical protein